ncbi:hypothetical protein [Nonomuraea roseoviolacea]|uniref:phosphotriesterase family protein n=1 Tax=Nonomuraea roseoviolacea TaxID=103837 RepID=UPI0030811947
MGIPLVDEGEDVKDYFGGGDDALAVFAPDWRYDHIHDQVLAMLLDSGVAQAHIDQMLVYNPRSYFA